MNSFSLSLGKTLYALVLCLLKVIFLNKSNSKNCIHGSHLWYVPFVVKLCKYIYSTDGRCCSLLDPQHYQQLIHALVPCLEVHISNPKSIMADPEGEITGGYSFSIEILVQPSVNPLGNTFMAELS